ncbi:MAG: hypothetical protein WC938_02185 [Candidatus Paceibacterota bacterium]|jgi:hypothetical protein
MYQTSKTTKLVFYAIALLLPLILAIGMLIDKKISPLKALIIFLGPITIFLIGAAVLFLLMRGLEKISEISGTDITFRVLIIIIILLGIVLSIF